MDTLLYIHVQYILKKPIFNHTTNIYYGYFV